LRASGTKRLAQALVAVSFAAAVQRDAPEVYQFLEVLPVCRAIRRLGCSSLNLAYLAAGRFDAYWALSTKAWDIAAGVLLVEEAGGTVTGIDGRPLDVYQGHFAAAATSELHAELLALLGRAERPGA
jgi:myo-inositol-1(or 4)-monophosphatase